MKEYRKTYKPLIGWVIALFAVMLAIAMLPIESGAILTRLTLLGMIVMLIALMVIVCSGEYVYWINGGPTFEQARDAGSDARKAYAWAHLRAFLWGGAASAALMLISAVARWPIGVDIVGVCLCMIVTAFSTIRIKFQK